MLHYSAQERWEALSAHLLLLLHTNHAWHTRGECSFVWQCTGLTIMCFFLGSALNGSPDMGAMLRIRSCLFGPSVNYSAANHACRIRFPLCHLQAQISDDQTAHMSARSCDTPCVLFFTVNRSTECYPNKHSSVC